MDKIYLHTTLPLQYRNQSHIEVKSDRSDFKTMLANALDTVNAAQKESTLMTHKLITGEVEDLHQVMIAAQKASITLDLTVQVRNKVVEAYQEIMRMQM